MALQFYDSTKVLYETNPLRSIHDGNLGGSHEVLIYIRNDDVANYYTDLVVSYQSPTYVDLGEFGDTGWGVKFMYGERQPTEAEWDLVRSGEAVALPDIGSTLAADTSTYHPIWVRVFAPGGIPAQIREGQSLLITGFEQKVGF